MTTFSLAVRQLLSCPLKSFRIVFSIALGIFTFLAINSIVQTTMTNNEALLLRAASGAVMLILFLVLLSSTLDSIKGRKRAFAILRSLGFGGRYLFQVVFIETVLLSLLGSILAVIFLAAFGYLADQNPLGYISEIYSYSKVSPVLLLITIWILFGLTILASTISVYQILKLQLSEALRK